MELLREGRMTREDRRRCIYPETAYPGEVNKDYALDGLSEDFTSGGFAPFQPQMAIGCLLIFDVGQRG